MQTYARIFPGDAMNNFTLYPFSKWLFLAMLIVTFIFMIYVFRTFLKLIKVMQDQQIKTDTMQQKLALVNIKTEVLAENRQKKAKQNRIAKMLIPALLAIRSVYKNNDSYCGLRGYRKATKDVLTLTPLEKFRKEQHQH